MPLFNKIVFFYVTSNTVINDKWTAIAIRELCNIRDGIGHLSFLANLKAVTESIFVLTNWLFYL